MVLQSEDTPGAEPRARIFISYSRIDMTFADSLAAALRECGFEPLIDRSEIYAFEDWWQRIETLIVRADSVLFILSPDAIASEVALKEVAFAASLNKRFAPVIHRRVDDSAIPAALARLNFIFFDDPADFEENITRLTEALDTDIEWIRRHTELGEAARRWTTAGRPGPRGLLLRPPILDDAERWIASRPQGAPSPTEDTQAFIVESRRAATRRRNVLTASLGTGFALALALLGLAYWMLRLSEAQRNDALIAQSQFLTRSSREATDEGNATLGALLALRALPKDLGHPDRPFLQEAAFALEYAFANLHESRVLPGTGGMDGIAISSDGTRIIAALDKYVEVLDTLSRKRLTLIELPERISSLQLLPGDARLVTEAPDGKDYTLIVWNTNSGVRLASWRAKTRSILPLFSPDGNRAVSRGEDKTYRLWDVADRREIATLGDRDEHGGNIVSRQIAFSPDGKQIATTSSRAGVRLWGAETGTAISALSPLDGRNPVFSHDGRRLLVTFYDRISIFDTNSGVELAVIRGPGPWDGAIFSPDERLVLSASDTSTEPVVQLWDANSGNQIGLLTGLRGYVRGIEVSADGSRVATSSDDLTIRLWDVATGAQLAMLRGPGGANASIMFSPDGSRLLVKFHDRDEVKTRLIDSKTGNELPAITGWVGPRFGNRVRGSIFSADGTQVVTALNDGTARVWDLATSAQLTVLKGHNAALLEAAFSPDGTHIVTSSFDRTIRLWTVEPASLIRTFRGHAEAVGSTAISPDGTRLVTASTDRTARIWNIASGAVIRVLRGHSDAVSTAAFSPDGRTVLTGSHDKTARIWDAETGTEVLAIRGHDGEVNAAGYSPDGARVVTASADGTARVWDSVTGAALMVLSKHPGPVFSAAFSPDGSLILTSALDGVDGRIVARIWNSKDGSLLRELRLLVENPRFGKEWNAAVQTIERGSAVHGSLANGVKSTPIGFSPDGRRIITGTYGWLVQLWESSTGLTAGAFPGMRRIYAAAFSPDGARVVEGAGDGVARVWTAQSEFISKEKPIVELRSQPGEVRAAAWLPDGIHVVTGSQDKIARLWQVPRCQALIDLAGKELPRPLFT